MNFNKLHVRSSSGSVARVRPHAMLVIAIVILTSSFALRAPAQHFKITNLILPEVVPPGLQEVQIECKYDVTTNFTQVNWFKGSHEIFRYRPGSVPSTRSFPTSGVGRVDVVACGPTACRLKLGNLTEDATGVYTCDIERDVPPFKFASEKAYMEVRRTPLLEGLAKEFGDGDEIKAYCRGGAFYAELRWYINGREVEELRGSTVLNITSSRLLFVGIPPMVGISCAEYKHGKLIGSNQETALWEDRRGQDETQDHRNKSDILRVYSTLFFMISVCLLKL